MNLKPLHLGFAALAFVICAKSANAFQTDQKRVLFEGEQRAKTLVITNDSDHRQTYTMEWRKYRMDKDGLQTEESRDGKLNWADNLVKFAPRLVSIPPGGSQKIHLLARKPGNLKDGEYRSHLSIFTEEKGEGKQGPVVTTVSVPVIVRQGETSAVAGIKDVAVSGSGGDAKIDFTLTRTGNASIYGDVSLICHQGNKETTLREVPDVAVYPEINERRLGYDVDLTGKNCDSVSVSYTGENEAYSEKTALAE